MNIPLNVPVKCTDGDGGKSTSIIMNPVSERVTHVVVQQPGLDGVQVMMPVDWITESTPEYIQARCTLDELAHCDEFELLDYVPADDTVSTETLFWPYAVTEAVIPPPQPPVVMHENIPEGLLEMRRGSEVYAGDETSVGKIDEFLIDAENRITHIVLRAGHWWGPYDVTIPVEQVDHFADGAVYLKLTPEQIDNLPRMTIQRKWL
jgi:hypothetical protein